MLPLFVTGTLMLMTFAAAIYYGYQSMAEQRWQLGLAAAVMALTSISAMHLLFQRIQYG